jgi:hypothetical protein
MINKVKRPRIEKSIKSMNTKMYEDHNQMKPHPEDPNEEQSTPLAPLPNSGAEAAPLTE